MRFLRGKSREEKEFERRLKLRQAILRLDSFISNCEKLANEYFKQAVEARRIEDKTLTKRFAGKILLLEEQAKRAKKLQLIIKDLDLGREQAGLLRDFAEIASNFAASMKDLKIDSRTLAKIEEDITKSVVETERVDALFGVLIDSISNKILEVENIDEKRIEGILDKIEREAVAAEKEIMEKKEVIKERSEEEKELDRKIEEALEKIKKIRG